jgi:hypothetical protein
MDTSPDGEHVWVMDEWAAKMSHWIRAGDLRRRSSGKVIFAPPKDWSFENRTWTSNDELRLEGRRYPGRLPGVILTLSVRAESGTIETEDLAKHQSRGSYAWMKPREYPAAPSGPQPFDVLLRWLSEFPRN